MNRLKIGRPALLGMGRELGEAQLLSFRPFKACFSAQASLVLRPVSGPWRKAGPSFSSADIELEKK